MSRFCRSLKTAIESAQKARPKACRCVEVRGAGDEEVAQSPRIRLAFNARSVRAGRAADVAPRSFSA